MKEKMVSRKKEFKTFFWRVLSTHTIAYFIAGIFALFFLNYTSKFSTGILGVLMRSTDSWQVAIGPGLQIIRGAILALVLYPFKDKLLSTKCGWLKLILLIFGLSFFLTIGPVSGSFEGYIYTNFDIQTHLLGIPEALLYTGLFSGLLFLWYKKPKKIWNVLSIIAVVLILLMSFAGVMSSLGLLSA